MALTTFFTSSERLLLFGCYVILPFSLFSTFDGNLKRFLVDIFKRSYRGIHYILHRTLFTNLLTGHIHFNDIVKIKSLIIKFKLTNSNENMFWLCFSRQEVFLFFILCFFFFFSEEVILFYFTLIAFISLMYDGTL